MRRRGSVNIRQQPLLQCLALGRIFLNEISLSRAFRQRSGEFQSRRIRSRGKAALRKRSPGVRDRSAQPRLGAGERIERNDIEPVREAARRPPRADNTGADDRHPLDRLSHDPPRPLVNMFI